MNKSLIYGQQLVYLSDRSQGCHLTIFMCNQVETKGGDHDFCLSLLHIITATDTIIRELGAIAVIESMISWREVAPSTNWATPIK